MNEKLCLPKSCAVRFFVSSGKSARRIAQAAAAAASTATVERVRLRFVCAVRVPRVKRSHACGGSSGYTCSGGSGFCQLAVAVLAGGPWRGGHPGECCRAGWGERTAARAFPPRGVRRPQCAQSVYAYRRHPHDTTSDVYSLF